MDEGSMVRVRVIPILLRMIALQLSVVPSEQQNLPGYLGCYGDDRSRALSIGGDRSGEQTVQRCFRSCLQGTEYKYAGLEYGDQCWCGNNENYDKHQKQSESDCRDSCSGNRNQICGDSWRLSVYRISDGVCSNDIGPPTNGAHVITNPSSVSYNLINYKFFGTRVDFSCYPGYTLHGQSSIECIETSTNNVMWSDSVPTCEAPTTTILTTFAPTTSLLQSTVTDSYSLVPSQNSTMDKAPFSNSTDYTSKAPGLGANEPNTGSLQTGAIVGLAVGAATLTALMILVVIFLCKKRRKPKKSLDVTVATIGDRYINNAYALPEIISQSINDQSTMPVYSQVVKVKPHSDDVYATPDDVTGFGGDGNAPSDQPSDATSPRDQQSGWVDNTLYASESFPVEPDKARVSYPEGHTNSGSPLTMEGKPGWVENIIYE